MIPVVDVFAGPGGLNEGFSSFGDREVFGTVASIEMDPVACETLRLRAAVRQARRHEGKIPDVYFDFVAGRLPLFELVSAPEFASHWKHALSEVHQHELAEKTRAASNDIIRAALAETLESKAPWVLVGGPPCQAYSLAGRSRRKHDVAFKDDHKHTLYREYLNIIREFRPPVFVMENVKGILSSQHDGGGIFQSIWRDLTEPEPGLTYQVRSFVVEGDPDELDPADYIIRAERYGVPQARHRVILLGVRSDLDPGQPSILKVRPKVSVWDAIRDLPPIRSGVSTRSGGDAWEAWLTAYLEGRQELNLEDSELKKLPKELDLGAAYLSGYRRQITGDLADWLRADAGPGVLQHTSRRHMLKDLSRYVFLAEKGRLGERPRVQELPKRLQPQHANAQRVDAPFADRFRVQLKHNPSSTVTSHIAKDGHYYIHYDPKQMRSLSVREAARLQTFPDNYFFMGNRTQQYHQVGNAVPPYLAHQLAEVVSEILGTSS
ncbi:DNA cytosine methyltransferase [Nocardioides sp. Root151]|uniref:DNA cytosine methyltransferase n=1 Tax=Nocardioides sp. Root151 TaxID=1736475 RepID=UPI000702A492|nr:DNA cytosine methyltransferase [Nocardioides sp. Root151]KQZ67104.1 hypothetical protein ASD66_19120 [Nocardioides sp. Root151]